MAGNHRRNKRGSAKARRAAKAFPVPGFGVRCDQIFKLKASQLRQR